MAKDTKDIQQESKTYNELYKDMLNSVKICMDSLKYIAGASPVNGEIRNRASSTIKEVERILKIKQ